VLLEFVDPNMLSQGEVGETPLHHLIDLAAPNDYSTHVNQLILAKQLIEHGANVNAVSIPHDCTPLHRACSEGVVTNLDFVELLLKESADPNAQDTLGVTPLMYTNSFAPGAARFLLNWPSTDFNTTTRSGVGYPVFCRQNCAS
jgi:ankyrin repeat protein